MYHERTHSDKYCFAKTQIQTFADSKPLAQEKLLERLLENQILPGSPQRGQEEFGLVQAN